MPSASSPARTAPWAIRMDGIGKEYRLGGLKKPNDNIREDFLRGVKRLFTGGSPSEDDSFWALKNITAEIEQGESVGIIGRNGAGKSTLLKVLSRITAPTRGEIVYRGRLASLLEVGTGFHRELTGRENIFLNGSILGMRRADIAEQLDAIVEFAAIDKFLDTPVKFYSSGMYVRLAFAVAAHLRTDILVVDEVLAVGDAAFQKKCLGKMADVASDGRTILFVSHNMQAVSRLCRKCLHLVAGEVAYHGPTEEAISRYLNDAAMACELPDRGADATKAVRLRRIRIVNGGGQLTSSVVRNEPAFVELQYDVNEPVKNHHIFCHIGDMEGNTIVSTGDRDMTRNLESARGVGQWVSRLAIPTNLLNEGSFAVTIGVGVPFGPSIERLAQIVQFVLIDPRKDGGPEYLQRRPGVIALDIPWTLEARA